MSSTSFREIFNKLIYSFSDQNQNHTFQKYKIHCYQIWLFAFGKISAKVKMLNILKQNKEF